MTGTLTDRNGAVAGITMGPADADDLDTLGALHAACFSSAWPAHDFAELLAPQYMFAFMAQDHRQGAAPCGFIVVRHAADEAEILTLGVDPSARRRGVATALLETSLTALAGENIASMFFEVAQDNAPACDFYRAHGFCEVGRRSGYYQRAPGLRCDAIVMRVEISNTQTT